MNKYITSLVLPQSAWSVLLAVLEKEEQTYESKDENSF